MIKTIPEKKKGNKSKWFSEEALQIAEKRREDKGKGEKERYTHLNAVAPLGCCPWPWMWGNSSPLLLCRRATALLNQGIRELRWTGTGEFNSDDNYILYWGQESLRRNGVAIIGNKRVQNSILGCNLKNDRMISIRFQGKPFNITVIQVYAPTSNAEEAKVEWFCEELQDFLN